jgi:hypothetical protein
MTLASQIENTIVPASVPVHRWQTAEAASSAASSATCYERSEHIFVLPVVMAERKFGQIHWQVVLAHLVISTDDPTLQERPEILDIVGMYVAAHNVLAGAVPHEVVRESASFKWL